MDLISLIIIISIIKKLIDKDREKNKDKQKQRKNTSADLWKQRMSDFADTASQRAKGYADSIAQQRARGYADSVAQQRATKERLEQKYGNVNRHPSSAKAAPKSDILSRAKENVKEEAPDTFKQQAHAEVCAEYRSHVNESPDLAMHQGHSTECDFEGESDIIKRVNDLMIMGYDGALNFDRDFIAEGVEMLNSFNL